jgi:hypothetical protein
MTRLTLAFGIAVAIVARIASGDCGGIPVLSGVKLFEPTQRAAIAFNGDEEILLLSTDLRASKPTKVLEVLPLPAEPKVSKGDVAFFSKATDLINARLAPKRPPKGMGGAGGMSGRGGGRDAGPPPAGVVTLHEKIGAHDITVTRVVDQKRFIAWVEDRLRKEGADNPAIPEPMKEVVAEYLKDRYHWFVFDVVDLGEELKTKDTIEFRFRTKALYYPMRITRAGTGDTFVQLLILSNRLLHLPKTGGLKVETAHDPLQLSVAELHGLGNKNMDDLLKGQPCWLRIWEVRGPLSGFKKDIVAK